MKQIYPFATLSLLALFFSFNRTSAQTVYTAVRNGNWHVSSGVNVWDPSGEPSANCSNCSIIINSGVTVHLNESVTLSGGSTLTIGTDNSSAAVLMIDITMGVSNFASGHNVILMNDGSTPDNSIRLANNISFITFSNTPIGSYDGLLTNFGATTYKEVGGAPLSFTGNTIQNTGSAAYGTSLTGPITLSANGTLPIILSQFDVEQSNKEVDLSWTTDMESNSDHFAVQRSTNAGARWDVLGTVAAKGNSSVTVHYSYTDGNPASGVNEYRLQSVDKDGKFTYSEVKTIRNGLIGNISIFPNPAKDYVNVTLGSDATAGSLSIRLISQSGQLLAERKVTNTGGTMVSLPVSNYPSGNYLIQVVGQDGTQQISKLLISKQ
jgi:hypothetical protein